MNEFRLLILVLFFAINSLNKTESVKLEETPLKTFEEIFGEACWDKGEAEDLKTPAPTNFGQNVHHQIDRQNTQLGQIEPNLTDQLGQIEHNSTDQLGQNEPNSTDQNPPPTESDHSEQIEPNSTDQLGQIELNSTDQLGQSEHNSTDQNTPHTESDQSDNDKNGEELIAEDERKPKFDQRKAELQRAGFKSFYRHEIDETVTKELGLSFRTIYRWKSELGQTTPKHKHTHNEQKKLIKRYYEIKDKKPKISDQDIAKRLSISRYTLHKWKKQFTRQQLHPNSVDGHSVEENAAANVQEIENSN
uniref:Transposase n=1 Tax=Globodera rostochiensis TaxID=31243 RepID=A0A914H5T5_GLORO